MIRRGWWLGQYNIVLYYNAKLFDRYFKRSGELFRPQSLILSERGALLIVFARVRPGEIPKTMTTARYN